VDVLDVGRTRSKKGNSQIVHLDHNRTLATLYHRLPKPLPIREPVKPSLDLSIHHIDVKRILYSGFSRRMLAGGFDREDVLSEVYRKIMVSNNGKHPFDPTKSSVDHYIYMACNSALMNYHKKENRRKRRIISMPIAIEDEGQYMEFPSRQPTPEDVVGSQMALRAIESSLESYKGKYKGYAMDLARQLAAGVDVRTAKIDGPVRQKHYALAVLREHARLGTCWLPSRVCVLPVCVSVR